MNSSNNGDVQSTSRGDEPHEPENSQEEEEARALLPAYLRHMVNHYHDDFYVSRSFDPRLIAQLMAEGFLPIATRGYLLPKLHVERCVLQLNPNPKLHISKSTRKKSRRFLLSVNECFDQVVAGCHQQHGTNWLYPPIVNAFRALHRRTLEANEGVDAILIDNNTHEPCGSTPVRLYSVEVWNAETGALAGGELGYSVGSIYTSLTGFSNEDAAGSVQLIALGKLLIQCEFEHWDLGMEMDYKMRIGAELMSRVNFVQEVRRTREQHKNTILQCGGVRKNAKELVDWEKTNLTTSSIGANCSRTSSTVTEASCQSQQEQDMLLPFDDTSSPKHGRKRPHE